MDTPPKLLLQVADDSGEALLPGALDYEAALAAVDPMASITDHSSDDRYILYTGGTTGMPKGTLWRQSDIYMAALGGDFLPDTEFETVQAAAQATNARTLPNAPFMHGAAQWIAMRAMLNGGTVVINDTVDRFDPAEVCRLIDTERVDATLMVGEAFLRPWLVELEMRQHDMGSLKVVLVGGAATSPETKAQLLEFMPNGMVHDAAGASETGTALGAKSVRGGVTDARIFDAGPTTALLDAAKTRVLDVTETDEGWFAKHGRIPLGYLDDAGKTAATFPIVDGKRWSVPGDRARYTAEGRIELLGRDSVTINSGGEKIFAEEVEAAVMRHPAVGDTIVVGRPSERWGSEVVAIVRLMSDTATDDEIIATAAEHVARYKLPKAIIRVPEIVRSPAGKADYRWAKATAGEPTT